VVHFTDRCGRWDMKKIYRFPGRRICQSAKSDAYLLLALRRALAATADRARISRDCRNHLARGRRLACNSGMAGFGMIDLLCFNLN
jgi:hypothetical protein